MKKITKFLALSIALLVILMMPSSVGALFFDEDNGLLAISNLKGIPGNNKVELSWNASADEKGNQPSKYTIQWGKKSVAEGMASVYGQSTESAKNSISINNPENGVPVYFAVNAIGQDGTKGVISNEIIITPNSGAQGVAPIVIGAQAKSQTKLIVEFSKDIILPSQNPELAFSVTEENNITSFLLVWNVQYVQGVKNKIELITDEQKNGVKYELIVSAQIMDASGNPIASGVTDSAIFIGTDKAEGAIEVKQTSEVPIESTGDNMHNASEEDITPPENVTNFIIKMKQRTTDFLMQLSWTKSVDSAGDLAEQLLRHSLNKGINWDDPIILAKDMMFYDLEGGPLTEHTFKISTKDATGNESTGVIESIRLPALPVTGPGLLIALGAGLAFAGTSKLRRKK